MEQIQSNIVVYKKKMEVCIMKFIIQPDILLLITIAVMLINMQGVYCLMLGCMSMHFTLNQITRSPRQYLKLHMIL